MDKRHGQCNDPDPFLCADVISLFRVGTGGIDITRIEVLPGLLCKFQKLIRDKLILDSHAKAARLGNVIGIQIV